MTINEPTHYYIIRHATDDVRRLALQGTAEAGVDLPLALQQIQGRQTAQHKLPTWAANGDVVFPPRLAMEQCSSEPTARYKAALAATLTAGVTDSRLVDLTGGLGVDCYFMSAAFSRTTYVERQPQLHDIARHNFAALGAHIDTVCADAADYLPRMGQATMVFLDPARRDDHGGRTYALADCTPSVVPLMDELLRHAPTVMLKLSPMLDWRKAVADVGASRVEQVHLVATGGECKELLLVAGRRGCPAEGLSVTCATDGAAVSLPATDTPAAPADPQPGLCLYEPGAALMKAGLHGRLARRYGVAPVAPNSHLFTSAAPVEAFPGRAFRIEQTATLSKHDVRHTLMPLRQANISVRNFPLSAAQLRQRLKLADGGTHTLFATTTADGRHVVLVCTRLDAR